MACLFALVVHTVAQAQEKLTANPDHTGAVQSKREEKFPEIEFVGSTDFRSVNVVVPLFRGFNAVLPPFTNGPDLVFST